MPFSTTIENNILSHYLNKASWGAVSAIYVGLSSTTPTKSGTNITEPSTGAYARQQITAAQWTTPANGASENNTDKSWAQATADWVSGANLTHFVFYDASSGGNFLGFASITTPKTVLNNDTAKILNGELDLAFS